MSGRPGSKQHGVPDIRIYNSLQIGYLDIPLQVAAVHKNGMLQWMEVSTISWGGIRQKMYCHTSICTTHITPTFWKHANSDLSLQDNNYVSITVYTMYAIVLHFLFKLDLVFEDTTIMRVLFLQFQKTHIEDQPQSIPDLLLSSSQWKNLDS